MAKQRPDTPSAFGEALSRSRPDLQNGLSTDRSDIGKRRLRDVFYLHVDRIVVDDSQVRTSGKSPDDPATKELAASIRDVGLLHFPVVRYVPDEDRYQIISGERRFVAMTAILGWQEIPVKLLKMDDADLPWVQITENLMRRDLDVHDLADTIFEAKQRGLSLDDIAAKLHKSKSWVSKLVAIAERLTDEAKQEFQDTPQGRSVETLYAIASLEPKHQRSAAQEVVSSRLGKRGAQRLTAKHRRVARSKELPSNETGFPFEHRFDVTDEIQITVRAERGKLSDEELRHALEVVLRQL